MFQPSIVPGLFQTENYARTVLTTGRVVKDIELTIRRRMERQKVLTRTDPPLLWVLLDEGVLDRPVGGPEVMREQLARLLEVSELPHVSVRVIPRKVGFHVGLEGAFLLASVKEGDVAYMEAWGGGRLSQDRAEVTRYGTLYDHIGAHAEPEVSSRVLIATCMENMT